MTYIYESLGEANISFVMHKEIKDAALKALKAEFSLNDVVIECYYDATRSAYSESKRGIEPATGTVTVSALVVNYEYAVASSERTISEMTPDENNFYHDSAWFEQANTLRVEFTLATAVDPADINYITIKHSSGEIIMQGYVPTRTITVTPQTFYAYIKL